MSLFSCLIYIITVIYLTYYQLLISLTVFNYRNYKVEPINSTIIVYSTSTQVVIITKIINLKLRYIYIAIFKTFFNYTP